MDSSPGLHRDNVKEHTQAQQQAGAPPAHDYAIQREEGHVSHQSKSLHGGGKGDASKPQHTTRSVRQHTSGMGLSSSSAVLRTFSFDRWVDHEPCRSNIAGNSVGAGVTACDGWSGGAGLGEGSSSSNNSDTNRPVRARLAQALTLHLCTTYKACSSDFQFTPNIPRRVLTNPSEGFGNGGLDNVDANLIARVNDVLEAPRETYSIVDLMGQGTFGQVFRCQEHSSKNFVAIKVIKNKPAYRKQAMMEREIATLLNKTYDPNNTKNIVRLLDCFLHKNHLCLVFELLSINLFELLKQHQFRGLPLPAIRQFIAQILEALEALGQANVIHCDLKPENVLIMNKEPPGGGGSGG
ncbi:unnamed protein product, partial [Choristocarpus tenellus]